MRVRVDFFSTRLTRLDLGLRLGSTRASSTTPSARTPPAASPLQRRTKRAHNSAVRFWLSYHLKYPEKRHPFQNAAQDELAGAKALSAALWLLGFPSAFVAFAARVTSSAFGSGNGPANIHGSLTSCALGGPCLWFVKGSLPRRHVTGQGDLKHDSQRRRQKKS